MEITTKLCDDDFARKAKAADFFARTWDVFIDAGAGQGEVRDGVDGAGGVGAEGAAEAGGGPGEAGAGEGQAAADRGSGCTAGRSARSGRRCYWQ